MRRNKNQIDRVMRMRGEGYTQKEIAKAIGITQPRVNQIIKRYGINGGGQISIPKVDERFQNIFSEGDAQKIKALWDSGINIARIAAMELATEIPDNVIDETNEDVKGKAIANYSAMVDIGRTRTIGGAALVEMVKKLEAQAKNNALSLMSTRNKICLSTGATKSLSIPIRFAQLLERGPYYKALWSGRGGGKSWAVAIALISIMSGEKLVANSWEPPVKIIVMRKTFQSIGQSMHTLFRDIINNYNLADFTVHKNQITHSNGSEINYAGFYPGNDRNSLVNRIKGIESVDICLIEEADDVESQYWEILVPTIRKSGSEIWATFNPSTKRTATYQKFIANPPDNALVIETNYQQNKFLSKTAIEQAEQLKKYDLELYEHIYMGKPREAATNAIFAGNIIVAEPSDEALQGDIRRGVDWSGGVSPAVCLDCRLFNGQVFIIDAFYKFDGRFNEIAKWISALEKRDSIVYCDSADRTATAGLNDHCSRMFGHRPGRLVQKWAHSVWQGIQYLRQMNGGKAGIVIAPHLAEIIAEFRNYRWQQDSSGDITEKPEVRQADHAIDALRYALSRDIFKRMRQSR